MASNRKKKIIISIVLLFLFLIVGIIIHYKSRIYYKYNDSWIIGKQKEQIVERYGEFDYDIGDNYGYFIGKDTKKTFGLSGSNNEQYYYIKFNENNIAVDIYIGFRPGW